MSGDMNRKIIDNDWAFSESDVRRVLLRAFPALGTNERQRAQAARWAFLIQRYFRMAQASGVIAIEMGITDSHVRSLITRIRRTQNGLSSRVSNRLRGKRGRPKKIGVTIHATCAEDTGKD